MLNTYYDEKLCKLVFPDSVINQQFYPPVFDEIYEGCEEDIKRAFNYNPDADPEKHRNIPIETLSKKQRKAIISKFKSNTKYSMGVMPGTGYKPFADQFEKVVKEIKRTKCYDLGKDKAGRTQGVIPPKGFFGIIGVTPMPWHLIFIDYDAQRGTDILHIIKILFKYKSIFAFGVTARFDPSGVHIDVNDGRHGAMIIALTGAPYCWGSGPVTSNKGVNYDIFDIKNLIPKKTELFDEVRIKSSRARLYDANQEAIRTEVGGRLEDQEAYDLVELCTNYGINLVSGDKKNKLDPLDIFRVDKAVDFFLDTRYTKFDAKDPSAMERSLLTTAFDVTTDVFDQGYTAHEMVWAICELFAQQGDKTPIELKKMTKACVRALEEEFAREDYKNGNAQSKAFYARYMKSKKGVPEESKIAGYLQGNSFVKWFLATELYSIIQQSEFVKVSEKGLFTQPVLTKDKMNMPLNDAQGNPFYTKNFLKTKTSNIDEDDYEEFEDVA